jgi:predicted amidohydrolase YtcJ
MKIAYVHASIIGSKHDAFIVENGRFLKVGKATSILDEPVDQVIDLAGRQVMPGFNDSHMHLLGIGKSMAMASLSQYKTIPDLIRDLKQSDIDPLIGRGFHEDQFEEKRYLNKDDLDLISTDKPIILYRVCGHMIVLNSKAIDMVLKSKVTLPSEDNYDFASGHFKEDAIKSVFKVFDKVDKETLMAHVLNAQDYLLKNGVTAVGSDDFSMYQLDFEVILDAIRTLDLEGKLKVRVFEQANIPNLDNFKRFIDKGYVRKVYNRYEMGPLKLLADGSLGARSAYMSAPYEDKDTKGIRVFKPEALKAFITLASQHEMDYAIHAIGDQMTEEILEATSTLEEDIRNKRRHSIIHAQLTRADQIETMKALNVGAQTQPIFINSDLPTLEKALGTRMQDAYLFYSLYKSVKTTISTDCPVEPINPFENMYTAIARKSIKYPELGVYNKQERFSFHEALDAYTVTPAYFMYKEDVLGKIEPGYLADFIVIEGLDEKNPDSLLKTKVLSTYIEGERVYNA